MSFGVLLRGAVGVLLVLVLVTTGGEAQQPEELPKAPESLKAVPVHVLPNMARASLVQSADGKTLLTSGDGSLRTWNLTTGKESERIQDPLYRDGIIPTPDGKLWIISYIVLPNRTTEYTLFDARTRKEVRKLEVEPKGVRSVRFTPDGKQLIGLYPNQGGCIWEVASGKRITPTLFDKLDGRCAGSRLAPNGRYLAFCTHLRPFRLVDVRTGQVLWEQMELYFYGDNHAFSPDSRFFAGKGRVRNDLRLFAADSGKILARLQWTANPPPGPILDEGGRGNGDETVTFAPDGRSVILRYTDYSIIVVEVATWQMRYRFDLANHECRLEVLPRGFLLATSTILDGQPMRLWDRMNPTLDAVKVTGEQLQQAVRSLEDPNATAGWEAMRRLATNPESVAVLRRSVKVVPPVSEKEIAAFVRALDHDDFEVRDGAEKRLLALGWAAQDALLAADKTNLSKDARVRVRQLLEQHNDRANPERLRALRAAEVLEYLASPEARQLLEDLSAGAAGAYLTEEARATLARMPR